MSAPPRRSLVDISNCGGLGGSPERGLQRQGSSIKQAEQARLAAWQTLKFFLVPSILEARKAVTLMAYGICRG